MPLLIALVSQGRTALAVTLRYVLALVPGLYLGAVLWWQKHPDVWSKLWFRRCWTAALALGLVLTLLGNPHRSLSALVPDSISPWVHVSPLQMLERRTTALEAVALIPPDGSVAADTPLLPLLARREALIRFPKYTSYRDRAGQEQPVDWVAAFPGYYQPLATTFKRERKQQRSIRRKLKDLTESGGYRLVYCRRGAVVLKRLGHGTESGLSPSAGSPISCPWLD